MHIFAFVLYTRIFWNCPKATLEVLRQEECRFHNKIVSPWVTDYFGFGLTFQRVGKNTERSSKFRFLEEMCYYPQKYIRNKETPYMMFLFCGKVSLELFFRNSTQKSGWNRLTFANYFE